jgi:hypothetical protein
MAQHAAMTLRYAMLLHHSPMQRIACGQSGQTPLEAKHPCGYSTTYTSLDRPQANEWE